MPEFRESLAHYLYFLWFWHHNKKKTSFVLLGLWADFTAKEAKRTRKALDGLVQPLDSTCNFKRGSKGAQTSLYPPTFRKTRQRPDPDLNAAGLELQAIDMTGRAIFLHFGALRLKLAYLTHTSIQVYKREQWETSIKTVSRDKRGKVGLALEFEEYFIAFISIDLVFQPTWEETGNVKIPLSQIPPLIYDDYLHFLSGVATWIEAGMNGDGLGLLCEVIRSAQEVWGGVGVYTICELCFDAGVSPFLIAAEAFKCPSRIARLCEAFYSYAYHSKQHLPALLHSAMVEGVLAPTQDQRLRYSYWLHVYAKDTTSVSKRMAVLIDEYQALLTRLKSQPDLWYRDAVDLYDVFEPNYIADAFTTKTINLGHLIFGAEVWKSLNGPTSSASDPLTDMYARKGLLSSTSHLKPGHYTSLYVPREKYLFRSPYAYTAKKQIWSITPSFPSNSCSSASATVEEFPTELTENVGQHRMQLLFSTIVNSPGGSVAIGPLEYCGNGRILTLSSGKKQLALTHSADPTLSVLQITNQAKRSFRLKNNLDGPGKAKVAMTEKQRIAQQKEVEKAVEAHRLALSLAGLPMPEDSIGSSQSHLSASPPSPLCSSSPSQPPPLSSVNRQLELPELLRPPAPKKRRISQDQRLALLGQHFMSENLFNPSDVVQDTHKRKRGLS